MVVGESEMAGGLSPRTLAGGLRQSAARAISLAAAVLFYLPFLWRGGGLCVFPLRMLRRGGLDNGRPLDDAARGLWRTYRGKCDCICDIPEEQLLRCKQEKVSSHCCTTDEGLLGQTTMKQRDKRYRRPLCKNRKSASNVKGRVAKSG